MGLRKNRLHSSLRSGLSFGVKDIHSFVALDADFFPACKRVALSATLEGERIRKRACRDEGPGGPRGYSPGL